MQLNGIDLVDRHNRPTVLQKVGLRIFFINDGVYYDPNDISGVTIFKKTDNLTPSSILSNNLVASSILSSLPLMHFGASANDSRAALATTSYNPTTDASSLSGIYRVSQGEYICVLDGSLNTSGHYDFHGSSLEIANAASSVNDYIDVWTIQFAAGSDYQTLINEFHLYNDTFFSVTEPLVFSVRTKLINKHLTLNSIEQLKFTTEVTIENNDIDESVKCLFKESLITSAQVLVEKVNEGGSCNVTVSGYSDTSGSVDITSNNTILWLFDTTTLATHPSISSFEGVKGTYQARVKFTILNETIVSPPFFFTVS